METVSGIRFTLGNLVASGKMKVAPTTSRDMWKRIENIPITDKEYSNLPTYAEYLGVTQEFSNVIATFPEESGFLPAGFRPELICEDGKCVLVNLKRDIGYAQNGERRPTRVLYSADSANPYEIEPIKNFVSNLTCNPAIIYNQFINNPKANIGNRFKNRDEVMAEIGRILGSGADISVEVNNPFADESEIFEEVAHFEEILTKYRLVVKIPHTGPVNRENAQSLANGSFSRTCFDGSVEDNLYGHNLAFKLQERGYRVNFTLMSEPHQAALALQAKPYFINTFIKNRYNNHLAIKRLLEAYDKTGDNRYLSELKTAMNEADILTREEIADDSFVLQQARWLMEYSNIGNQEGFDGLDSARHSLRWLRDSNLPDTRLILCSMAGPRQYPYIDKMLMEPEFADMLDRVVVTAPPKYLAQFTCAPGILTYQKLFLNAVK